jgi:hypothetical protein
MANKKTLDTQNKTVDTKKPKAVPKVTKVAKADTKKPKVTSKAAKVAPKVAKANTKKPKVTKALPKVPKTAAKAAKVAPKVAKADTKKPKVPKTVAKVAKAAPKVAKANTKKPKVPKTVAKAAKVAPKVAKADTKKPKVPKTVAKAAKAVSKVVSARVYNIVRKPLRKSRQSSRQKVIKIYMVKMKIYGGGGNEDPEVTSLEGRIAKYNIITNELNPDSFTKSCLVKLPEEELPEVKYKITGSKQLVLSGKEDVSKSVFGDIYKTDIGINEKTYEIVSKFMKPYMAQDEDFEIYYPVDGGFNYFNQDNKNEVSLMKAITSQITSLQISKHFMLMYFYSICEQNKKKVRDGSPISYIMYTEPANGDLRSLFLSKIVTISNQTILNILIQSILSLGTFHNMFGYIHKDAHMGNFLYQNNSEYQEHDNKYYNYDFDGISYYLKSCEYNIMIYDFGKSKNIKNLLLSNNNTTDLIVANIKAGFIKDMKIFDNEYTFTSQQISYNNDEDSKFYITTDGYPKIIDEDVVIVRISNELIKDYKYETNLTYKTNPDNIYNKYLKYINQNINTQIRADYIHLVEQFYVELREGGKDQTIIKILRDNLIPDIETIVINENNSDEKEIFKKVIELCFKHLGQFGINNIFLQKKPEGDDNIINKENPYKIYEATKMVVPNIP